MLQVELKFKLTTISTKVDFFSLGQIFSTEFIMNCLKMVFPFSGDVTKKMEPGFLGKIKK